jgi:hypothetical protein
LGEAEVQEVSLLYTTTTTTTTTTKFGLQTHQVDFLCTFCSGGRAFILNDKIFTNCKIDAQALQMVESRLPVYHLHRVYHPGFIKPSVQRTVRRL